MRSFVAEIGGCIALALSLSVVLFRGLRLQPNSGYTPFIVLGMLATLAISCSLFRTDDRYSIQGSVQTCHFRDGILVRCFDEPNDYMTIRLDGERGKDSTDYRAGSFRFEDVLEGGYRVSVSFAPDYVEELAADGIWSPPVWIFVPPPLLSAPLELYE